ncbi:MAG: BREX-1 system phosphatase PglZ type B [Solirubrobacteraceae bacterium]
MTETGLDALAFALDRALAYDPNVAAEPVALLWPDRERQWESVVPLLQVHRRIVVHGDFAPSDLTGPAYWLRCVIASTIAIEGAPPGTPVVYLPGVSRDDLRNAATTTVGVASLAGLQHRSQWFVHPNGKDWTIRALLSNPDKGLGLNVDANGKTATALVANLKVLLEQPLTRLANRYINADLIASLANPDPTRTLLEWIDDPKSTQSAMDAGAWAAFLQHCASDLGFDPVADGEIEAARRLGEASGPWRHAWQRFRASPGDYERIPDRLRQAQHEFLPPNPGAWPDLAEQAEDKLRSALSALKDESPAVARQRILELENEDGVRRGYVWADLDWTPLVVALEPLAKLAKASAAPFPAESVDAISKWYAQSGWQVDRAALEALAEVERKVDCAAVNAAVAAIYRPWLDAVCREFQAAIGPAANAGTYVAGAAPTLAPGEVIAFVDGLRLDVGQALVSRLASMGLTADVTTDLAALPTVTPTAKPALVPIPPQQLGPGKELDARRLPEGPSATISVLRKLMAEADVEVLGHDDLGDPTARAWTEAGEIDQRGHELGLRLAYNIDDLVERIARRVRELLDGGWQKVTIVTDHGWHLLPGGLPKNEGLKVAATATKTGRCARIKEGAHTELPTVPWHWDPNVRIALAPGIECFEANQVYEHGGVSPQECVVPRIAVASAATGHSPGPEITKVRWRGLTLVVEFADLAADATVDLRTNAGDPASSVAQRGRSTSQANKVMLLVEDDDLEGKQVRLVVAARDETLLIDHTTTVGRND